VIYLYHHNTIHLHFHWSWLTYDNASTVLLYPSISSPVIRYICSLLFFVFSHVASAPSSWSFQCSFVCCIHIWCPQRHPVAIHVWWKSVSLSPWFHNFFFPLW
jgi:hypothetical protein